MLYVESVMDLRPWGYWTRDGKPYERTAEVGGAHGKSDRAKIRSTLGLCIFTFT